MLNDEDVEDAVMDKIWNVAKTNKNLYVDQYECGRFGGEDVPNIRLKYRIRFANEVHDYLSNQKKLEDEKEMALE